MDTAVGGNAQLFRIAFYEQRGYARDAGRRGERNYRELLFSTVVDGRHHVIYRRTRMVDPAPGGEAASLVGAASGGADERNRRFLQGRLRGADRQSEERLLAIAAGFGGWLQGRNTTLIQEMGDEITRAQRSALQRANAAPGSGEGAELAAVLASVRRLVQLFQHLTALRRFGGRLDAADTRQRGRRGRGPARAREAGGGVSRADFQGQASDRVTGIIQDEAALVRAPWREW